MTRAGIEPAGLRINKVARAPDARVARAAVSALAWNISVPQDVPEVEVDKECLATRTP